MWDGRQGIEVGEEESIKFLGFTHEQRLEQLRIQSRYQSQYTRQFGASAEHEEHRDFSRVRVLTTDDLEGEPDEVDPTSTSEILQNTQSDVESLMPESFEEMRPGTVFTFNRPGAGEAYYVWDGREGVKIDMRLAEDLANLPLEKRLAGTQSTGRIVDTFGKRASADINKDFSRVDILAV